MKSLNRVPSRRTPTLYFFVGLGLAGVLVGVVFLARLGVPKLSATELDFPRTRGPGDAAVEIIEYSDFQCPACQHAQAVLSPMLERYSDRLRLTYRHFPLEGHRWAFVAHQAAECAARQDRFWPYHDRLYGDQPTWSQSPEAPLEVFLRYAKEEGLELEAFGQCLADPSVAQAIREDQLSGRGLGVRSTPSFFVKGELVVGIQRLQEKIDRLMSQ